MEDLPYRDNFLAIYLSRSVSSEAGQKTRTGNWPSTLDSRLVVNDEKPKVDLDFHNKKNVYYYEKVLDDMLKP